MGELTDDGSGLLLSYPRCYGFKPSASVLSVSQRYSGSTIDQPVLLSTIVYRSRSVMVPKTDWICDRIYELGSPH